MRELARRRSIRVFIALYIPGIQRIDEHRRSTHDNPLAVSTHVPPRLSSATRSLFVYPALVRLTDGEANFLIEFALPQMEAIRAANGDQAILSVQSGSGRPAPRLYWRAGGTGHRLFDFHTGWRRLAETTFRAHCAVSASAAPPTPTIRPCSFV